MFVASANCKPVAKSQMGPWLCEWVSGGERLGKSTTFLPGNAGVWLQKWKAMLHFRAVSLFFKEKRISMISWALDVDTTMICGLFDNIASPATDRTRKTPFWMVPACSFGVRLWLFVWVLFVGSTGEMAQNAIEGFSDSENCCLYAAKPISSNFCEHHNGKAPFATWEWLSAKTRFPFAMLFSYLQTELVQKHPAGRFSARVFSTFFFHTSGMGSSFSMVFTMFFLFHVLFWCLKCCHLQW